MIKYFCDICGNEITNGRNYAVGTAQKTLGRVVIDVTAVVNPEEIEGDPGDALCRACIRNAILNGEES